MRMRLIMATGVGAALLSACASGTQPARLAPPSGAAPAPMAGYDWFFHADGNDGRLAYGVAESDELKLGLACAKGGGRLEITALSEPGTASEIHLESGGETERWPAKAEPAVVNDDDLLTAFASTGAPVFQRFRQLKWIAQWRGEAREAYAAHRESEDGVERFFAFCG